MRRWKVALAVLALATAVTLFKIPEGLAEENYESWAVLKNPFESTGGGGVMIGEYHPVIVGNKCTTNFTATLPMARSTTTSSSSRPCRCRAGRCAPKASGAPATAAPPAPRPSACSSRTV